MKISLSTAAMRFSDAHTINDCKVPSLVLMERAGRAIADQVKRAVGEDKDKKIVVACGGGNNGGDGFVCARLLLQEGYLCTVCCRAEKFSPDCEEMKRRYEGALQRELPAKADIVVDCLFGTGLTRPVEGEDRLLVEQINRSGAFVIAADIPSGLNGDNGTVTGVCVRADITVTIGYYKNGLFLADGKDYCGKIVLADIGIERVGEYTGLFDSSDLAALFPARRQKSHKGTYGKACLIAGSMRYAGAALLSAKACLRAGAGYTTLYVPKNLTPYLIGCVPEMLLRPLYGADEFMYSEPDLKEVLSYPAIAFGPGVGVSDKIYRMAEFLLKYYDGALILDADAIRAIAKFNPNILQKKSCKVILTPHLKEFSLLCGKSVEEIEEGGVKAAQYFALRYGVTLCLKSNTTIVTDGTESILVAEGTPALAKGGSGDALAGIMVALLARGVAPLQAAAGASFLLGRAGALAAENSSEYSVVASDVIENIGKAILSCTQAR